MSGVEQALADDRLVAIVRAFQPLAQQATGMMPVERPLDEESDAVLDQLITFARKGLAALDALPPKPRAAGPLNAADAEALRLDLRAGSLLILASDGRGRFSAALTAQAAETEVLGHDEAHRLWTAVTGVLRALPDDNPEQPQEPSP